MLIEKVDDGSKFPRCPDCGAVLYQEEMELSNLQKEQEERWNNCTHEYLPASEFAWTRAECIKCGYSGGVLHIPCARLMRCPVCAALYHVEGD